MEYVIHFALALALINIFIVTPLILSSYLRLRSIRKYLAEFREKEEYNGYQRPAPEEQRKKFKIYVDGVRRGRYK